jgi:hypothetical protein
LVGGGGGGWGCEHQVVIPLTHRNEGTHVFDSIDAPKY